MTTDNLALARPSPKKSFAVAANTTLDTLRVQQPTKTPHGTLMLEEKHDATKLSPYVLVDESGRELPTQWDRVLSFVNGDVVELTGYSDTPVSGTFAIRRASKPQERLGTALFTPDALKALRGQINIALQVDDLPPVQLAEPWDEKFQHRLGFCRITVGKQVNLGGGIKAIVRADIRAGSSQVDYTVELHNCAVPVKPDAYFGEVSISTPAGWEWMPLLTDGAHGANALVKSPDSGSHILPRLYRRPFRFAVLPEGEVPHVDGWGATSWNRKPANAANQYERLGGFMPHGISVPDLSHAHMSFATDYANESAALLNGWADPLYGGSLVPPSVLWPMRGISYGGGTSGTDITQHPGVEAAATADPLALELLRIEALRYGARQRGHMLDDQGQPKPLSFFVNTSGGLSVKYFNNQFLPGGDGSLGYFAAASAPVPIGTTCAYKAALESWAPIDSQHLIRAMKSQLALVWLDNDPLAKDWIRAQAVCSMLSMHGKVFGTLTPFGQGGGTPWGRGEAWDLDIVAACYAIDQDPEKRAFLERGSQHLEASQMPSGLVSQLTGGKVTENFPLGHFFGNEPGTNAPIYKPCATGIHPPGPGSDYAGGRSNEQCYVLIAHRAIRLIVGVGTTEFEAKLCTGLQDLAWATDANGKLLAGVLDRYPSALMDAAGKPGAPFTTRADVPDWAEITAIPSWNAVDNFDAGSSIGFAAEVGINLGKALKAFTGKATLAEALAWFEAAGARDIGSRANTLEVLQRFE